MILSTRHLPEEDLALFALQLLEGEELDRALDHLEHCEECRHEIARFQGDLVGYALAMSELHSPPAQARDRLLKKVAKEKKVVPVERPRREAAPVQAERPLQQMAERLAQGQTVSGRVPVAQPVVPDGDPRESRTGIRVAQPMVPSPTASQPADEDRELFLASRGRRMFESVAPLSDDEETETPRGARGLLITMAVTGWAIAACMAVMAGMQYRQRLNIDNDVTAMQAKLDRANAKIEDSELKLDTLLSPNAMHVALNEPVGTNLPPSKPEGHVAYQADKGALLFIADHLTPLPPSKTYELWLLQPDGGKIPAGLFKPDARGVATVVMPELPKGVPAHGFGVTVENEGGSPTPTGSIVLVGF